MLQNLLANALEYSTKDIPVQIRVTAEEIQDFWQFAVADNGIGIGKGYHEKIFVIFNGCIQKKNTQAQAWAWQLLKK